MKFQLVNPVVTLDLARRALAAEWTMRHQICLHLLICLILTFPD